jgi:hypothetical protein
MGIHQDRRAGADERQGYLRGGRRGNESLPADYDGGLGRNDRGDRDFKGARGVGAGRSPERNSLHRPAQRKMEDAFTQSAGAVVIFARDDAVGRRGFRILHRGPEERCRIAPRSSSPLFRLRSQSGPARSAEPARVVDARQRMSVDSGRKRSGLRDIGEDILDGLAGVLRVLPERSGSTSSYCTLT